MSLEEEQEIFIKYIINLSRGIDNCLSDRVLAGLDRLLNQKASTRFLDNSKKELKRLVKDELFRHLYAKASQREKNLKKNSVPFNQALVIFVTAFETLLYDMFCFNVNNNQTLKNKIIKSDNKIPVKYLEKYKNNEITFADIVIIIKRFNFQNLYSANEAFIWATDKSIFKILKGNDKSGVSTISRLSTIIQKRHKIIHEAYNDNQLDWKDVVKMHTFFLWIGLILHGKLIFKV